MSNLAVLTGGKPLVIAGKVLTLGAGAPSGGGSSGLSNVSLFGHGQSNAGYANDVDGALLAQAQLAAFYLGATGTAAKFSQWNNIGTPASDVSGAGVYCGVSGYPSFLTWTADTAGAAAAASYGSYGTSMLSLISALTSGQRAATLAIVINWGETDSACTGLTGGFAYADKAVYEAALLNDIAQIRAAFGKSAAQLPVFFMGPPYGTPAGSAMVREAWCEIALNAANNAVWNVQQTYDSITRGDNWKSSTGVETAGSPNSGHRSPMDNVNFYRRGALAVARGILASNGLSASLIPSALGAGLGPQITVAHLSGTTVTLTIVHDGGTDLVMPSLASPNGTDPSLPAQGVGFCVMDGGSITSPGAIIKATACARVDATHLALTLASAPVNAAASCKLFYPWPGTTWTDQPLTEIGTGCAWTDNFGTIAKPSGFDANAALGTGWAMNMPLRHPMTISGGSATFGLALS